MVLRLAGGASKCHEHVPHVLCVDEAPVSRWVLVAGLDEIKHECVCVVALWSHVDGEDITMGCRGGDCCYDPTLFSVLYMIIAADRVLMTARAVPEESIEGLFSACMDHTHGSVWPKRPLNRVGTGSELTEVSELGGLLALVVIEERFALCFVHHVGLKHEQPDCLSHRVVG